MDLERFFVFDFDRRRGEYETTDSEETVKEDIYRDRGEAGYTRGIKE